MNFYVGIKKFMVIPQPFNEFDLNEMACVEARNELLGTVTEQKHRL